MPVERCGAKGDGSTDDGPAVQNCVSQFEAVSFGPHAYRIASPVVISAHPVRVEGVGWSETFGDGGTYIVHDNPDISPFTLSGPHARGTVFRDLAVHQVQPPPAPGWKPRAYPPVFVMRGTAGATSLRNVLCNGVYACVSATGSGRLNIDGLYGQVFQSMLSVAYSYDSDRISNVHVWPYWSADVNVMAYQQANTDALVLGRQDTAFVDAVFGIGLRSVIHVIDSPAAAGQPGGTATKLSVGRLGSDGSKYALWISGTGVTMQVGALTHQSATWAGSLAGKLPLPAIPGSAMLFVDGPGAILQIGSAMSEVTDQHVAWLANTSVGSQLQIQSIFAREYGGTPFQMENVPSGRTHVFRIGTVPMLQPLPGNRAPPVNGQTNANSAIAR